MSPPRPVRMVPPTPTAAAAAILLVVSAVFSLALGIGLLLHSGNAATAGDYSITLARPLLVVFGIIALGVSGAKFVSGAGVLLRRPWAAVLGVVLAGLDAFFTFPTLGGRRTGASVVELVVDGFIVWALLRHLNAMPKEAEPGGTWTGFQGRPQA